ncbi:hypothetical protein CANARDRAFT_174404 [[Candida] arabinofermentans NRRL YB-2248]|uniref:Uncharacterized protein n=1 Tax=[Candida] arabinofermentans NRRL YB-2248 TaxID=983967 RepID=A0A1E4T6I6_9ASCO|nr:hypothetical protein CANARDRAFT_174404 [[Candida] arabinofermentans NRRL YB-2248]
MNSFNFTHSDLSAGYDHIILLNYVLPSIIQSESQTSKRSQDSSQTPKPTRMAHMKFYLPRQRSESLLASLLHNMQMINIYIVHSPNSAEKVIT